MRDLANTAFFMLCACFLVLALGAGTTCCSGVRPPPVVIQPTDTDKCAAACARLSSLGCPEGAPLEDGTSCTKFCVDTQKSGHALNPSCVMNMQSCGELQSCTTVR